MPAVTALNLIKQQSSNMAMVIDEFGGLLGIVTLFDIMESIMGDIAVSDVPGEGSVVERTDGSWLVDGLLAVDELKELLSLNQLPDESAYGYQTLGGMIMAHMGKIPRVGQHVELGDYRFEVVDMDGRRVDKVLVSRHENPSGLSGSTGKGGTSA
jgi:putative hemolysin